MADDLSLAFIQPAFALASANPIAAVRTLARALRQQSAGAQRSAIRILVTTLAESDRTLIRDVTADLQKV
jgi:hypothetical protein